jgi:membrane protease YdiL (CAAX protease family)
MPGAAEDRGSLPRSRALLHGGLFWCASMGILVGVSVATRPLDAVAQTWLNGLLGAALTYAASLAFLRWDRMTVQEARLRPGRTTTASLFLGLLAGTLLAACFVALLMGCGVVVLESRTPSLAAHAAWTPAIQAIAFLALALREEIAFRGYLLEVLQRGFGRWSALPLMAVPFALEHLLGGASAADALVGAGLGALVFGVAALATRSLAFPLGLHAAWNTVDWATGGKADAGLWLRLPSEVQPAWHGLAIYAAVMGFALCCGCVALAGGSGPRRPTAG